MKARLASIGHLAIYCTLACLVLLALPAAPGQAGGGYGSFKDEVPLETFEYRHQPETQAHGCYYHRGRRYCARYCYWEVNGNRYCRERLRGAHSQWYYPLEEEAIAPEVRYRPPRR